MNTDIMRHPIVGRSDGMLLIDGYSSVNMDACFTIVAYGHRYHEYGIADNSLLYCCETKDVVDGDLVVAFEGNKPTLYQYREDNTILEDGEKRILHDRRRIHAKVLGSFNFYQ